MLSVVVAADDAVGDGLALRVPGTDCDHRGVTRRPFTHLQSKNGYILALSLALRLELQILITLIQI